jgi:hypothetical protein
VPAQPAGSTPPADLRLDLEVRKSLRAVVFDANAFGHARPDLAFLGDLAQRLHGIAIETWVPEPVAWEWAQHLAEDWEKVQTAMAEERRRLRRAGLIVPGPNSPYQDASAVVEAFLARLTAVPHLKVIPLTPENALRALKDQILLIPPGRRKNDVKTGASDSAWLRAVLDQVAGDAARLLFVGEDNDIKAAFRKWGKTDPLTRRRGQLKATMSEFTVDEGGAGDLILRYLITSVNDSAQDEETLGFDIDATASLEGVISSSLAEDEPDTGLYGASLTRLTGLAGVTDIYIESAPPTETGQPRTSELGPALTQTALATVYFLADAEAAVQRLYNGSDPQDDGLNYDDVLVRVPMSFDIRDRSVTAVRSEDDATVSLPPDGYRDPSDATAALLETLSAVPGLTPPEAWPADGVIDLVAGADKTPVHLETTDIGGGWRVRVTIGDDTAELSCTYDASARTGDREDTYYFRPPYQVDLDNGAPLPFNPLWALNQWILTRS